MKLRPVEQASRTTCIRCNTAFTEASGQIRAVCSSCDYQIQELHYRAEYALYGKTYYRISPEGTSYDWLNASGYVRDVCASPAFPRRRGTPQADELLLSKPSPQTFWTFADSFARLERNARPSPKLAPISPTPLPAAPGGQVPKKDRTWAETYNYPILNPSHPQHANNLPF